jgi:hypothetical protein
MKVESAPLATKAAPFSHVLLGYRAATRQPLALWASLALLSFVTQIIFRREMHPGEFGTFNTALALVGVLIVPVLALHQAITLYVARPHRPGDQSRVDSIRAGALLATETFAWMWGAVCLVLVFALTTWLHLPRFSIQLFTLLNVLAAIGSFISCAIYERGGHLRRWMILLASAALARVLIGAGLVSQEPWAESGLATFLIAGLITLGPALQSRQSNLTRLHACVAILDRDFMVFAAATFSLLLGLVLFTNADRLVGQSWFGVVTNNNMGLVNWPLFDAYQTAGLLARSLLWGTQPLLWILFAERSQVDYTRAASLKFFWIYLGVLILGVIALSWLATPLSELFCGNDYQTTARFVPSLAAAMIPLGLLQGLGIFSLASRRYHECFVLGGCSVVYTLVLYFAGRQPQLMPAYMFGIGLVCCMAVLFVGVVRWGRKQP